MLLQAQYASTPQESYTPACNPVSLLLSLTTGDKSLTGSCRGKTFNRMFPSEVTTPPHTPPAALRSLDLPSAAKAVEPPQIPEGALSPKSLAEQMAELVRVDPEFQGEPGLREPWRLPCWKHGWFSFNKANISGALPGLIFSAHQGNPSSAVILWHMFDPHSECYKGTLEPDNVQALQWQHKIVDLFDILARAVRAKIPEAQMCWGLLALSGFGSCGRQVTKDWHAAADMFRQAADSGCIAAKYELATCYAIGRGVCKNMSRAKDLFEEAARRGHTISKFRAAQIFEIPEKGSAGAEEQLPSGANDTASEFFASAAREGFSPAIKLLLTRRLQHPSTHEQEAYFSSDSFSDSSPAELKLQVALLYLRQEIGVPTRILQAFLLKNYFKQEASSKCSATSLQAHRQCLEHHQQALAEKHRMDEQHRQQTARWNQVKQELHLQ